MAATLKLTHKAIGAEVRRGTYDIVVDGQPAGSLEMNNTIGIPVAPGRHTVQLRNGRNSSRTETFDAAESETVAFRCTGKRFLPIFLASFIVPSLALKLKRKQARLTNQRAAEPPGGAGGESRLLRMIPPYAEPRRPQPLVVSNQSTVLHAQSPHLLPQLRNV